MGDGHKGGDSDANLEYGKTKMGIFPGLRRSKTCVCVAYIEKYITCEIKSADYPPLVP